MPQERLPAEECLKYNNENYQNFINRKSKQSNEHLAEKTDLKKRSLWSRCDSLIYPPSDKRSCSAAPASSTSSPSLSPSRLLGRVLPTFSTRDVPGGTSQTKPELLAPLVTNKAQTSFPSTRSLSLIDWEPLLAS